MRARQPDSDGYVERDGVKLHYEVFGSGGANVVLLPTWSFFHSRHWKLQVPDLARRYRVIVPEGRGNGRSDRPAGPGAYTPAEFAADVLAVMNATGTERAVLVGLSAGTQWGLELAANHPDRVAGLAFIGPAVPFSGLPPSTVEAFEAPLETYEDWDTFNANYWRSDYRDFAEFFTGRIFTEPHSTKPFEDGVGWALETDPETLIATYTGRFPWNAGPGHAVELAGRVACPVLVVHGEEDAVRHWKTGARLAELTGGEFVLLHGSGHAPHVREPVKLNLLLREFIDRLAPPPAAPARREWTRALRRRPRALYLSSPIGLGHARRDLAIARELRTLRPELEIDWLAQDPVTRFLGAAGERVHPASAALAGESAHIQAESHGHDLHAFQAIRRMDEILLANFMVFSDVVAEGGYDLVVGDEAWDVDHFLFENPELKRTAFAWMTDFVGWLPMPEGGEREAALTADYNAEMIEHVARYPRIRDRAVFVGDPGDVVPERFGPGLPAIRDWTEANFGFAGYVTGIDPAEVADTGAIRAELGWRPDERVCVVAVGGSGVGRALLERVLAAAPLARRRVPGLRMVVVTGPRIDPGSLDAPDWVELRGFILDLHRVLAACDLAVVQGGLTTTMELVAARRPFLYFPLGSHFEQRFHVAHRLDRYRAGRRMEFATADPDAIADAMAAELDTRPDYLPVDPAGAARAATLIADLV
jgi:pimeloyl-ACP methyl ester carboxylesterase/predicted glycosyltransferase